MQGRVPGTLLSGLGGHSLLEEGAAVLEEGCILLCVRPRVDPPVPTKVRVLVAFLVQLRCLGQLRLFSPEKSKLWVSRGGLRGGRSGEEGGLRLPEPAATVKALQARPVCVL